MVAPESRMKGPYMAERFVGELCFGEDARNTSKFMSFLFLCQSMDVDGSSMIRTRYSSSLLYQFFGIESVLRAAKAIFGMIFGVGAVELASRITSSVLESSIYAHPE